MGKKNRSIRGSNDHFREGRKGGENPISGKDRGSEQNRRSGQKRVGLSGKQSVVEKRGLSQQLVRGW